MMVGQENFIKMKYRPMPPLEELKEFLDYNPDTGIFTWIKKLCKKIKVGQEAGSKHPKGYISIQFKGQLYLSHRIAYYMYHGVDPLEKMVDHKHNPKTNNKIDNLRLANNAQNQMHRVNLNRNNTSGVIGVYWNKKAKKWYSKIYYHSSQKHLGYFINKEDAIKARREAEIKYFGDFRSKL